LVRGFSQELSDRYDFAVDVALHAPRDFPGSDPRNFHAHLLATTREVSSEGLGAKTTLELNDSKRRELGLDHVVKELLYVRERWATVTNEALRDAHVAARIDHRTLEAQGINREPTPHIPRQAFEMERRGYRSEVAERIRRDYEARVQARLERGSRLDPARPEPAAPSQTRADHPAQPTAGLPESSPTINASATLEEIRRQARESWLRLRQESAERSPSAAKEHGHDDELAR
jgi:hypothetical protein